MPAKALSNIKQNTVYNLFKAIQKDRLNYVYRGKFTKEMTQNIVELIESNLLSNEDERAVNRKVYHVMVEGLQNITRHQAEIQHNMGQSYGLFALKKEEKKYYLTTGNIVENKDINDLSCKIDKLNQLDNAQLKNYHKEILKHGEMSEKGGAGLGLIDIARRAGSRLLYTFNKVNSKLSYFYLHTEITPTSSIKSADKSSLHSFFDYQQLHPMLNNENILMVFNNTFNQGNLLDILSFVEKQMSQISKTKRKMFNILIEMFQNITKHGAEYEQTKDGKSGIFYLAETRHHYCLTTGNYIENKNIRHLRGRLNYLNKLDIGELKDFFEKRLFDFDINSVSSAGLGLIDLRIKSEEKLDFDFVKVNNEHSFYSLRVKIKKQYT